MKIRNKVIMLVATLVIVGGAFGWTLATDNRPVLGLDLQGGISIVLFPVEGSDLGALDTAVDIIRNRVDALGIAEPEVNRQGNTIVVDLPGVKDRQKAEALVGQTAELRFRPVQAGQILPWDLPEIETTTTVVGATTTTVPGETTTVPGETTTVPAETTTVPAETTTTAAGSTTSQAAGRTITTGPIAAVRPAQESTVPDETTTIAAPTTTPPDDIPGETTTSAAPGDTTPTTAAAPEAGTDCSKLVATRDENLADATVWLPGPTNGDTGEPDLCYHLDPAVLTGRGVSSASAVYGQQGWEVLVKFRNDDFVTKVATPYVNQQVAIELDGVVQSAPNIQPGITGREVTITGEFSEGEARDLALVLKYGSLPVQFDPDEQTVQSVSPSLGKDQLRAGIVAGVIGLALVALYMILYYRILGVVVWLGLALTSLFMFALVSYLSANQGLTLTLAGVTGLIVSVGVTVDSYVVYFERLKDEVRSGKTIRSSLEPGFHAAFRTILAADFVSLLGAAVLYWLATGGVRGFAFFLGLSTAIDLVLAYFFMHPMVLLMSRRPALVRMPGVGIASGLDVPGVRS